jgi:hypothetical protein
MEGLLAKGGPFRLSACAPLLRIAVVMARQFVKELAALDRR